MTALEKACHLVNKWISECLWLGPKEQGTLLIHMIAELVDRVEQEAYERGWNEASVA